jgi:hypothetical protein
MEIADQVDNGMEPIIKELHRIPSKGTAGTHGQLNVSGGDPFDNRDNAIIDTNMKPKVVIQIQTGHLREKPIEDNTANMVITSVSQYGLVPFCSNSRM